jgi:hypothetical protein
MQAHHSAGLFHSKKEAILEWRKEFPVEYRAWSGMKDRCCNPRSQDFRYYGGRGIKVCRAWMRSFQQFLADLGRKPSPELVLGRRNINRGYSPSNCHWTTLQRQVANRRMCKHYLVNGARLTVPEAERALGFPKGRMESRLAAGRSLREATSPDLLPQKNSRLLTLNGETLPLPAWAKRTGLSRSRISHRLNAGWPVERALSH